MKNNDRGSRALASTCSFAGAAAAALCAIAVSAPAGAEVYWPENVNLKGTVPCEEQVIDFPSGSRWSLCVAAITKYGLVIRNASFRRAPSETPIGVLYDGRLGEIFVPYHPGTPRYGDISQYDFPVVPLSTSHCPSPRTRIVSNTVCKDVRDSGLAYMDDALVRRGQEVSYWAALDAANYNYVIEFTFKDDGTISARVGSTGPKLGGPDDETGHMHNFTWRLDFDIRGSSEDTVQLGRHVEDTTVFPSSAMDHLTTIRTEGGRNWVASEFTTLSVVDRRLKNGHGRQTAWEITPSRKGRTRHTEDLFDFDFWVSVTNAAELLAINLPTFVADGASARNTDVTIWYTQTAHHHDHMRDEDRQTVPLLWTGFDIVPKNLFDETPFY